jgi:hypothetical protein
LSNLLLLVEGILRKLLLLVEGILRKLLLLVEGILQKLLLLVESISSQLFSYAIAKAFDISFDAIDVCLESVNLGGKEVDKSVSV